MRRNKTISVIVLLILSLILVGQVFGQTSYVVQRGDTLYSISRRFGVSVQAIAAANNIVNPNLIYAGQTLTIPGGESSGDGSSPPPSAPPPPAAPPAAPAPPPTTASGTYVVKPGDTLFRIAASHGVTVAALVQVNGITNPNLIYAGQTLTIPGSGSTPPPPPPPAPPSAPPPAPTAAPPPPAAPVPVGTNLLPNGSFEDGYYHQNGIPELQVPNHWHLEIDQGQPAPVTGITFLRPESRVMPRWLLPPHEQSLFVWNGDWTVKVFKGGAPISFRLFTDVYLQPGTYQFAAGYFPDLVVGYNGSQKIWSSQPASGEVAFIKDGAGGWTSVSPGSRNTLVQTFTVPAAATVRLGVAFRTRYVLNNSGFFLDDWSLRRLSD